MSSALPKPTMEQYLAALASRWPADAPTSFGIVIPKFKPARDNSLIGGHWSKGAKLKKADALMIGTYFRAGHFPTATRKRLVGLRVIVGGTGRLADPTAYWKSVLDALVKCGALVDDSTKWCETTHPIVERGGNPRTEITLMDM